MSRALGPCRDTAAVVSETSWMVTSRPEEFQMQHRSVGVGDVMRNVCSPRTEIVPSAICRCIGCVAGGTRVRSSCTYGACPQRNRDDHVRKRMSSARIMVRESAAEPRVSSWKLTRVRPTKQADFDRVGRTISVLGEKTFRRRRRPTLRWLHLNSFGSRRHHQDVLNHAPCPCKDPARGTSSSSPRARPVGTEYSDSPAPERALP